MEKLLERITQLTAVIGDPLGDLARTIQGMVRGEVDPYLLAGVLVEGAAQAVLLRVPAERRMVVSVALMQLLRDRLSKGGEEAKQDG